MYTSTALLVLAAATASALTFAERAAAPIQRRSVTQGWSVQSDSAPDGTTSCGGDSYCPSSLFCFPAKNSEVAPCCATNEVCVGQVEGAPVCADSSWNLYVGIDGNGFCCEAGMVGVLDRTARTMACVASADVGSKTTAILTQSGSGAAATAGSKSSSASAASSTTATTTGTSSDSSSSASTGPASLIQASVLGSIINGTSAASTTTASSTSSPSTAAANTKQMAMGLFAAGLMVAAL